ncbi:hypothetical protein BX265_6480 [Streptomyces sp. TLI_235]|nr:hypothetical protein BX265_6480 [Streptomyces sp. TLI_235]
MLLAGGGNDLIATHLHLSLDSITYVVRLGCFVVPVLTFFAAKRWCLGLQRRDRDKVLHGRESGIVTRLPHGEYTESHTPLPPADLHRLTAHHQHRPADGGTRLHAALSRTWFGPGGQIAKPTAEEYREVTDGSGHH